MKEYAEKIHLYDKFQIQPSSQYHSLQLIDEILEYLLNEYSSKNITIPSHYTQKRELIRGLLNCREPKRLDADILLKIDLLLQQELQKKDITTADHLENTSNIFADNNYSQSKKFCLWKGDITTLKVDAIVNAANREMLGCFQPLHSCIDNAIHSFAGPQLRDDCNIIITTQGELEATGNSKITRAYNLPSQYVLHTVGPIVPMGSTLTNKQRNELASCYISCLNLANELDDIKTIAFCAISTGVYGFPKSEAAEIAIQTINDWLENHTNHFNKIIFNVFSDEDYMEYSNVFMK